MTWKKRCVSLIVCFALVVSITVVRPPKAEALAFEAGIAVPIIIAVAIASGITFLSEGMTETSLTEYIGQQLQSYAMDIGTTVSEWWNGIGSIARRDDGKVVISNPTYQNIQNFLSWWTGENDVVQGTENKVVSATFGYTFSASNAGATLNFPVNIVKSNTSSASSGLQLLSFDVNFPAGTYSFSPDQDVIYGAFKLYNYRIDGSTFTDSRTFTFNSVKSIRLKFGFLSSDSSFGPFTYPIVTPGISLVGSSDSILSVSQPASYDALELQDNESVALDLGSTVEAGATLEDILAEYLAKIVDNTATAAQEVTTENGDGEDETSPYLPFIPRIWEKLQGLPDDIAEKVHDLFVPSAAFVEALPAEFADVFDSRCGLLTYPASLLADFLTRLATLTAQEPVLRWGNINEPFSDRQLIAAGSYNLNSAIQTDAMQTVYNVYMIVVKAAVAFWFVELCKRKYEKIIRS